MNEKKLQVTTKQHILPRLVLSGFQENGGRIQVVMGDSLRIRKVSINSEPFIAMRKWDQYSESGRTTSEIERNFGMVCHKLKNEDFDVPGRSSDEWISKMYCLWKVRWIIAATDFGDYDTGIRGGSLSEDVFDELEANRIIVPRNDGKIPARQIIGPSMEPVLHRMYDGMKDVRWGVVQSLDGDFCFPDFYSKAHIIPVSSKICLIGDHPSGYVQKDCVKNLNLITIENASCFIAARDFNACPGIEVANSQIIPVKL